MKTNASQTTLNVPTSTWTIKIPRLPSQSLKNRTIPTFHHIRLQRVYLGIWDCFVLHGIIWRPLHLSPCRVYPVCTSSPGDVRRLSYVIDFDSTPTIQPIIHFPRCQKAQIHSPIFLFSMYHPKMHIRSIQPISNVRARNEQSRVKLPF